ncbi:hypothetical protein PV325_008909 [Microctonus aethiopoides]|uniref:PDZ domain-containing protein n=1 Tax=Microctonus aethiopoides TaxID=144406 RepID=A0AA39FX58_9HYME|nr:hypothetical protein PV325_008909 [Microctonus aethiopoides]KAK0177110.1 hypothetical protein PV328_001189 [Microctonus aethiopoides]
MSNAKYNRQYRTPVFTAPLTQLSPDADPTIIQYEAFTVYNSVNNKVRGVIDFLYEALSAKLFKTTGDHILEINGVDVRNSTYDHAAATIKNAENPMRIIVQSFNFVFITDKIGIMSMDDLIIRADNMRDVLHCFIQVMELTKQHGLEIYWCLRCYQTRK